MVKNITQIIKTDFSSLPEAIQLDILLKGCELTAIEAGKVADELHNFLLKTNRFKS